MLLAQAQADTPETQLTRGVSILERIMKPNHLIALFVLLVGLTGCSTTELRLPVGSYHERSPTSNFIEVSTNQVRVHIEGMDNRDKGGDGLLFEYLLYSNGRVFPVVSRSAELLYGYPALDYRWNGEGIVVNDPKSGLGWEFLKAK